MTANLGIDFGNSRRSSHSCIIAVSENQESLLVMSDPCLLDHDIFDGSNLADNITSEHRGDIPKEAGVYKCDIIVNTFKSNHPQDPEEWDMTTFILPGSLVKLNVKSQ